MAVKIEHGCMASAQGSQVVSGIITLRVKIQHRLSRGTLLPLPRPLTSRHRPVRPGQSGTRESNRGGTEWLRSQAVIESRDRVLGMVIASRGFVEGVR